MLTTNFLFFLETKQVDGNFSKDNVLKIKEIKPKITHKSRSTFSVVMGNTILETRIPKLRKSHEKINKKLEDTLDFFDSCFLVTLLKNKYVSRATIDKMIKINNKKGYILEVVASFPKSSNLHNSYLKTMNEKAETYFKENTLAYINAIKES